MTSAQICIMIAIIVYLIGMIYIGFRCSKKNNSTDDFYLGGRKLGPFVTAMSAEASDMIMAVRYFTPNKLEKSFPHAANPEAV